MAGSRLQRIGTIYSRVKSLLDRGVMQENNKPLWYDVYEAFPPIREPTFNRIVDDEPKLKQLLYAEDELIAKFHKNLKIQPTINLLDDSKTYTRYFLDVYKKALETEDPALAYEYAVKYTTETYTQIRKEEKIEQITKLEKASRTFGGWKYV